MMKFLTGILLLFNMAVFSQSPEFSKTDQSQYKLANGFPNSQGCFIKNIGQYGQTMAGYSKMGKIKYGFEGFGMPVLFTQKGLIHLQRKIEKITKEEEKRLEKRNIPEEEIERKRKLIETVITMEWLGANPRPQIIAEDVSPGYYTFLLFKEKASGYKKITYKDLYPGIDVIYHFINSDKAGFEYSIVIKPGADLNLVKMKYGGDVKKITVDKNGNLAIGSLINNIIETAPVSFTNASNELLLSQTDSKTQLLPVSSFHKKNNIISFIVDTYDRAKTLVVDPFISTTVSLSGVNNGIAKDIDYDYNGNIYVAGGGEAFICKLAKYNAAGVLQWTFNGSLTTPTWTFGQNYGGWVVEKTTGKIFLGQGYFGTAGTKIIRLTTAGFYDNYITTPNTLFREAWKMLWSCNGGSPQILVLGGSTGGNVNYAQCTPPLTTLNSINITGIPTSAQDIADIVLDPLTNDMYTIFSSQSGTPFVNNRMYKNPVPYSASNIAWSLPSGFLSLREGKNRPYLASDPVGNGTDNSINGLAINSSWLFYWDGLNLKAFNKTDGSIAGLPLVMSPNTVLMQGGIIADECNNIFIGNNNGTIKVYKFNGSIFDDAAAPDIIVSGFPTANVYDLAYDQGRQLLYACGNGFVSSFDISSYCATTTFSLSVIRNCQALSAQAVINPAPPMAAIVTYILYNGATQIATNNTGLFTGLATGINYTITASIDQACGGIQLTRDFEFNSCPLSISGTFIDPTCNLSNGSINTTASFGTLPYQFSKDGISFQPTGIFTGLLAGNYIITVKDAMNAISTINFTLVSPPTPQVIATATVANCNINDGSIIATGSGGILPLLYSIDGINFQVSNSFPGLPAGNYIVTIKDANSCTNSFLVIVPVNNTLILSAGNDITFCEGSKATLTASSNGTSFLWSPVTGLNNPAILNPEASPVITTLYTLSAINGTCTGTSSVTVFVKAFPILFIGNDTSIAINQPLQLYGIDVNNSGFTNYNWSPSYGLNDPFIVNPIAVLDKNITYTLTAQNAYGCIDMDDIKIKVFEGPEIYVPNAFTPNNDGKNDILKAIPIGIKEFKYFTIFNSYGQLLFTTNNPNDGWDGNYKGAAQGMDTYVWIAEAIDYRGKKIQQKGTVTLIR